MALAIVNPNEVELQGHQLFLGGLPAVFGGLTWLAVLVESVVHAEALAPLLPGFMIQALAPPYHNSTQLQFPLRSITTLVAAAQSGGFEPTVVINAMGGPWIPRFERLPPAEREEQLVVIDFEDEFCESAASDSKQRAQRYVQMGYHVTSHRRGHVALDGPIKIIPYQTDRRPRLIREMDPLPPRTPPKTWLRRRRRRQR